MKLLNRIAVVTGAASGIGGRAAVRLAGEGAKLFLMDVNPDGLEATRSEILASGGEAVACPCDVSDEAAVKAAVMQAMDAYGRIDILVNVAGVQITKLLADTTNSGVAFFGINTANEGSDNPTSRLRYGHDNRANFLMLDGHVETFGLLRVPDRIIWYWEE